MLGQLLGDFVGGFNDQSNKDRQANQEAQQHQDDKEQEVLMAIANSPDVRPESRAAAVTGLLTRQPGKQSGFDKWFGKHEQHPAFGSVLGMLNGAPGDGASPTMGSVMGTMRPQAMPSAAGPIAQGGIGVGEQRASTGLPDVGPAGSAGQAGGAAPSTATATPPPSMYYDLGERENARNMAAANAPRNAAVEFAKANHVTLTPDDYREIAMQRALPHTAPSHGGNATFRAPDGTTYTLAASQDEHGQLSVYDKNTGTMRPPAEVTSDEAIGFTGSGLRAMGSAAPAKFPIRQVAGPNGEPIFQEMHPADATHPEPYALNIKGPEGALAYGVQKEQPFQTTTVEGNTGVLPVAPTYRVPTGLASPPPAVGKKTSAPPAVPGAAEDVPRGTRPAAQATPPPTANAGSASATVGVPPPAVTTSKTAAAGIPLGVRPNADLDRANKAEELRLKAQELKDKEAAPDVRDQARLDKSYQYHTSRLDKVRTPLQAQNDRLDRLDTTIQARTPQADTLLAPELLTALAGGQGSGLRMNEAEISRVVGGRSNWEGLKAKLNQWQLDPSKALSVTDAQRTQMRDLATQIHQRVRMRLDTLDQAGNDLIQARTPDEHRQIVQRAMAENSPGTDPRREKARQLLSTNGKSSDDAHIETFLKNNPSFK